MPVDVSEPMYFDGTALVASAPVPTEHARFLFELECVGIDPDDAHGYSVSAAVPTTRATLRKIENPLSDDSARYLRRWVAASRTSVEAPQVSELRTHFQACDPTEEQLQQMRALRVRICARNLERARPYGAAGTSPAAVHVRSGQRRFRAHYWGV